MMANFKIYSQEKNGVEYSIVRFKHDGKWMSKSIPVDVRENEREVWATNFINSLGTSREGSTVRTVGDIFDAWKNWKEKRVSQSYFAAINTAANRILGEKIEDLELGAEIDSDAIIAWINRIQNVRSDRTGKTISPATVKNSYNVLKLLIEDAMDLKWIPNQRSPFDNRLVREELEVSEPEENAYLLQSQLDCLLNSGISEYRKVLYLLAALSGLRESEIQGLTFGDLHNIENYWVLFVKRQLVRAGKAPFILLDKSEKIPKSSVEPRAICWKPKSIAGDRKIVLHDKVVAALLHWKENGWLEHAGRMPEACDPIFPTVAGTFQDGRLAENLRSDLVCAGLPVVFSETGKPFTFHSLRRTFITLCCIAGIPEYVRDYLSGHSGRSVAARNYLGRDLKMLYSAIMKLDVGGSANVDAMRLMAVNDG